MSILKASLVVQSHNLDLQEISAAMARQPDSGYDRGSLAPLSKAPRKWTSWSIELEWPPHVHAGTEGLAVAIESLGDSLAQRCAGLAERGCKVVISIHQEVADTPDSVGLNLTAAAIRWIARAGASVDVDQYIEGGETRS